jgi:hypothetical protein
LQLFDFFPEFCLQLFDHISTSVPAIKLERPAGEAGRVDIVKVRACSRSRKR